ncbi:oxidoreductase family protein [Trichoderma gamsii]|uniref:Oxidoreductase family protein n=1 Tax=Trichoderma gamsii TaxID=398673 RepID=A0A2P4ZRP9_9HYPO|nr:oxidoreductase family protein [Trichoderma gamsii]PON26976.1 oxidoreductase family protein [Trichoderma gamsii]
MAGIAILGAGIFATEAHLPALVANKANLKAVYSRSTSTASALVTEATKLGVANLDLYADDKPGHALDDLLQRSDIDAVIIVLPILIQPTIVRQCLAAGKHVLCEKPIAKDVKTARDLIGDYNKLYADKGLIFSIAEQFRFMHEFELGRKWVVEEKAIGDITQAHLRVWRNQPPVGKWYETPWRKMPEFQGGFLLDGGVHQTALLRFISGQEVVETQGFARQVVPHLPPLDTLNAGILLSGGGTGTISMSFASLRSAGELTLIGTKGSFHIVDGPDGFMLTLDLVSGESRSETVNSKGVELEIKAFLEAIKTGNAEKRSGPEEALNDLAIIESMCQGGGKVDLY